MAETVDDTAEGRERGEIAEAGEVEVVSEGEITE